MGNNGLVAVREQVLEGFFTRITVPNGLPHFATDAALSMLEYQKDIFSNGRGYQAPKRRVRFTYPEMLCQTVLVNNGSSSYFARVLALDEDVRPQYRDLTAVEKKQLRSLGVLEIMMIDADRIPV